MDVFFVTLGGIFVPLGFFLHIEFPQDKWVATAIIVWGLLCWLLGYWFVKKDRLRQEKWEQEREQQNSHITALLASITEKMGVNTKQLLDDVGATKHR